MAERDPNALDGEPTEILVDDVDGGDAEAGWPVSDLYRVDGAESPPPTEPAEDATVVVAGAAEESPRRRFPLGPGPGLLAAIAAAILGIGVAAWLVARDGDDDAGAASAPTQTATNPEPAPTTTTPTQPSAAAKEVPDVVGMRIAQARSLLEEMDYRVRIARQESGRTPSEVVRQRPPAGASLAADGLVVLTVARPAAETVVRVDAPDVVGLPVSEASAALRDAGLRVQIELTPSGEPAGTVLAQAPSPGTELAEGSLVALEVAGADPSRIELPDVVGMTVSQARSRLRELGLRVRVTRGVASEPAGTVIRQAPRAGAELRRGATVTLSVSTGPTKLTVPDVSGLDEESARLELEGAGFQVRVTDESTDDPAQDGLVVRQSPQSGATASEGAVVTITVARFD